MGKRLFLIDGNSFCYRAFYAIRALANSKGQPTNAIYGFITMLNKLIKDERPDYLGVAFDLKGPTFRHEKFEKYKIARKPMPDELISQMPLIKQVLEAYNIPIFQMQGYEADDILATIARKASKKGVETFIVTGDKDALQLVGDDIKVCNTHKDGLIFDAHNVKEKFGVPPDRITDLIALMGDSSDGIPGVTGVGEKTALELLSEFGSLENLYKNLDKIKSAARRAMLEKYKEQALMSRELAVLDEAVPIEVDFKDLELKEPDKDRLAGYFREFEFKALLDQVIERKELKADYELINKKAEFEKFIKELKKQKLFEFDFETTNADPMKAAAVGVSFCWSQGRASYVDFGSAQTGAAYVLEELRPIFEDARVKKIGQNIKYEKLILANYGIDLKGIYFDTMVASYLLNPSRLSHNLGAIAIEYMNHKMTDITELIGKGKKQITMDLVDADRVCRYCCEDSDVTFRLEGILAKELHKKELYKLFESVEMPLVEVLSRMEFAGVSLDSEYLSEMSGKMEKRLASLTRDIYEMAGGEFNINSPKQLQEILFVRLKLPPVKKTKTGMSTNEEVLEKLAAKHPLPKALLEFRELSKLKFTYLDALRELINPKTGRVHTSFNQTVTATGRLSSSDPNLQNIPVRTEIGRQIRKAFVPRDRDSYILSADYSQIELRILAHLSKDKTLIEAFKKDADIHTHTASLIFDVRENGVTDEQRALAKTVNFGIVYGMSAYGLSNDLQIPVEKAQEFINAYFERYPKVKDFIAECVSQARENGFVTTLLNRRRYIPEINSENISIRNFAERTAVNTPLQGTAADLIKLAMIEVDRELISEGLKSVMIMQVHDELVLEVPGEELKKVSALVRDKMENVMKLMVPIKVNCAFGKNWLELKPLVHA